MWLNGLMTLLEIYFIQRYTTKVEEKVLKQVGEDYCK